MIKRSTNLLFITIIFAGLVFHSCFSGTKVQTEAVNQQVDQLIQLGDESFDKMHLYAWYQAEKYYTQANKIKSDSVLTDKLFNTLCLIIIRQNELDIHQSLYLNKILTLKESLNTDKQRFLLTALTYDTDPDSFPTKPDFMKNPIPKNLFDTKSSLLDAYLYNHLIKSRFKKTIQSDFKREEAKQLYQTFIDQQSPMTWYLNFDKVPLSSEEILQIYPNFYEYHLHLGTKYYKKGKVGPAIRHLNRALGLIPQGHKVYNILALIYLGLLEDEKALDLYQQSYDTHKNEVALFGMATCMHRVNRFKESDQYLDLYLQTFKEHTGQAYYFKAYNRHLEGDDQKSGEFITPALKHLEKSGEVNYLAGVLEFLDKRYNKAAEYFKKSLRDYTHSRYFPLYYLGQIEYQNKNFGFFSTFKWSLESFKTTEEDLIKDIEETKKKPLEKAIKERFLMRKQQRLEKFQKSSQPIIEYMQKVIKANIEQKTLYDQQQADQETTQIINEINSTKNINQIDPSGSTLIHKAIAHTDNINIINLLIRRGINLELKDQNGYTPLHWAALCGQVETLKMLIANQANLNCKNQYGLTPLHDAAYQGDVEMIKLLLKHGADPYLKTPEGKTPLAFALSGRKMKDFELLKPLHSYSERGNLQALKNLLKKNPGIINQGDEKGQTPLHIAVKENQTEMVKFLLSSGADINSQDFSGWTPLKCAQDYDHQSVTDLLQSKGAFPTTRDLLKSNTQDQAVIWYLKNKGWVIKTLNHFLVINYQAPPYLMLELGSMASFLTLNLDNGYFIPKDFPDQQILYIKSSQGIKVPESYHDLKNINIYSPGESTDRQVPESLKIVPINKGLGSTSLIIQADGINITYITREIDLSNPKTQNIITQIQKHLKKTDILFLPFFNDKAPDKVLFDFIDQLTPQLVYLLPSVSAPISKQMALIKKHPTKFIYVYPQGVLRSYDEKEDAIISLTHPIIFKKK